MFNKIPKSSSFPSIMDGCHQGDQSQRNLLPLFDQDVCNVSEF